MGLIDLTFDVLPTLPGRAGNDGLPGLAAAPAWVWNDAPVSDSDPGGGSVAANTTTLTAISNLYFDDLEQSGGLIGAFVDTFDDSGDAANRGKLYLQCAETPSKWLLVQVTGSVTTGNTYRKTAVQYIAMGQPFEDGDIVAAGWYATGPVGLGVGTVTSIDASGGTTGLAFTGGPVTTSGSVTLEGTLGVANGGTGATTAAAAFAAIKQNASTSQTGVVELATTTEVQSGGDTSKAVTPAGLTAKEATAQQYQNNTANRILTTDQAFAAMAETTLTDAATVAWDMATGFDFTLTLAGNRTMGQPTNQLVGKKGRLRIVQDATGSRTLAWHTDFEFANGIAPTLSTAANAQDILYYDVLASGRIIIGVAYRNVS